MTAADLFKVFLLHGVQWHCALCNSLLPCPHPSSRANSRRILCMELIPPCRAVVRLLPAGPVGALLRPCLCLFQGQPTSSHSGQTYLILPSS